VAVGDTLAFRKPNQMFVRWRLLSQGSANPVDLRFGVWYWLGFGGPAALHVAVFRAYWRFGW
jgi:hypothetical protein